MLSVEASNWRKVAIPCLTKDLSAEVQNDVEPGPAAGCQDAKFKSFKATLLYLLLFAVKFALIEGFLPKVFVRGLSIGVHKTWVIKRLDRSKVMSRNVVKVFKIESSLEHFCADSVQIVV